MRIDEAGDVGVAHAQARDGVAVAIVPDEVRRGAERGDRGGRVPGSPGLGAVVEPGDVVARKRRQQGVETVAALGDDAVVEAQVFAEEQRVVHVGVPVVGVGDRLRDEGRRLGGGVDGGAADVDLGEQVHVAAVLAVGRLAPERVVVGVPCAVEAGEVEIAGHGGVGFASGAGVGAAVGHGRDVAAEQHVGDAPGFIGVRDAGAQLGRVVDAGEGGEDVLHRRDLDGQSRGDLVVHEPLEGVG